MSETTPRSAAMVRGVGPIGMNVSDIERAVAFYRYVLSFEPVESTRNGRTVLRLGDEFIALTEQPHGRAIPARSRSNDGWFQHIAIVVADMTEAYGRLRAHGVESISTRPQTIPQSNRSAGGIEAFYFQDPDGHPLELLRFPAGRGAARWHERTGRLFLGIDHTAITVADTERSLAFYRDALGFAIAGESLNFGLEQEELSSVRGARVRITSLRAAAGPGIELLDYRAPCDGLPYPPDARPTDLLYSHTTLFTSSATRTTWSGLFAHESAPVAPDHDGSGRRFLMRDPDGHALEIIAT